MATANKAKRRAGPAMVEGKVRKAKPRPVEEDSVEEDVEEAVEQVKEAKGPSAKGLPCLCGCGQPTRTEKAKFIPGHDAKLKGVLLKVERGELPKSAVPDVAKPFLARSTMSKAWMFPHESGLTSDEQKYGKPFSERKEEVEAERKRKEAAKKEKLAALKANKKGSKKVKAVKPVEADEEEYEDEDEE